MGVRALRNVAAGLLVGIALASGLWLAILVLQWLGVAPEPVKAMLGRIAPFAGDGRPISEFSWPVAWFTLTFGLFWLALASAILIEPKRDVVIDRWQYRTRFHWNRDDPTGLHPRARLVGVVVGAPIVLLLLPVLARMLAG